MNYYLSCKVYIKYAITTTILMHNVVLKVMDLMINDTKPEINCPLDNVQLIWILL